ncbi:IclR family transcriptional regulator [Roseobacter sinensis]|uniref:IclR family transcriptional regulator n=1 Tax=Roseobacter sinensis TaxID=2931391 RepID=A0ABT3BIR5_9RHOB|nr:IclR family transcriptional regulator [Roseobacter sp. WL0113]MCV3273113.1 IclR family transcriptional regulator [Roseobacter sp. WL0113]
MTPQKRQRGRPKSQFRESSAGTLQSLDRALGILTAVSKAERATLTDLSLSLGVPTATTHRILTTLQKHGFVAFDDERQDWVIGIEAYRTGVSFLNRTGLSAVSRPIMRQLMERTGETANLAIADGAEVVFVAQIESNNPIRAFFARGTRTSMHASGTGKAILSALPEAEVRKMLLSSGLTSFTDNTLTTPDAFFADLATTRERGWSFDREERYAGMSCIGSVIYDEYRDPCAGVSISGPSTRFDTHRVPELGATVADAARQITQLIGGRFPDHMAGSDRQDDPPDHDAA